MGLASDKKESWETLESQAEVAVTVEEAVAEVDETPVAVTEDETKE